LRLLNPLHCWSVGLLMFVESGGAAYLQMKTDGEVLARSRTVGMVSGWVLHCCLC
jgi:cytochrome bd-type quinol oxidase subunit 2